MPNPAPTAGGFPDHDRRLFVGIMVDTDVRTHLISRLQSISGQPDLPRTWETESGTVRLTNPERWHMTVAFLGEVQQSKIAALIQSLSSLPAWPAPHLTINSAAAFSGRIMVARVEGRTPGDSQQLQSYARRIRHACVVAHARVDRRPWQPHITMGRRVSGKIQDATHVLSQSLAQHPLHWTPSSFSLIASILGPHPRYEPLLTQQFTRVPPTH